MPFNPLGFVAVGMKYFAAGMPQVSEQFETATWKVVDDTVKGLEVIVAKTPKIGTFELRLEDNPPQMGVYASVTYYATARVPGISLYQNRISAGTAAQRGSSNPDYIEVQPIKKGTNYTVHLTWPNAGRLKLKIFTDNSGKSTLKRTAIYNAKGKVIYKHP